MQTIFFVHDTQESPTTRKNYLEMAGFEVVLMKNGDECLKALATRKPALVLMDVLLEGKNGFEVCRAIRQTCSVSEVPVILASHIYRSRIYRDEAHASGAQRYLLLPMKLDDLIANITDLVASGAKVR
jgi:DNA-binding response OmpR family regulator